MERRLPVSRRTLIAKGMLVGAATVAAAPLLTVADVLAQTAPEFTSAFSTDRTSLKATRVTAAGVETTTINGETLGKSPILQFLNRKATAVAIYSAPPVLDVPARTIAADAPEFLFIIKGATTITSNGKGVPCGVGTMVLLEGGSVSEKAGKEGYTAIRVRMSA